MRATPARTREKVRWLLIRVKSLVSAFCSTICVVYTGYTTKDNTQTLRRTPLVTMWFIPFVVWAQYVVRGATRFLPTTQQRRLMIIVIIVLLLILSILLEVRTYVGLCLADQWCTVDPRSLNVIFCQRPLTVKLSSGKGGKAKVRAGYGPSPVYIHCG